MNIPRSVWISIATVSAILMVAGTVWWLRTRSVSSLTTFATPQDSSSAGKVDASSREEVAAAIRASDEIVNRPVFFVPEPQNSPGINIVYPSDGAASVVTTGTRRVDATLSPEDSVAPAAPADPGEADPDQDGLSNNQEGQLGTDAQNPDTDGDGIFDGDEVKKYRTDPLRADSDGDSYTDAEEIKNGYNPLGSGKCLTSDCAF